MVPINIDADMPSHRAKVLFRNQSRPCFVISQDKLASDIKLFREIAQALPPGPRTNVLSAWLTTLAEDYEVV